MREERRFRKWQRRKSLPLFIGVMLAIGGQQSVAKIKYPLLLDRFPPGSLLEQFGGQKAVLPQGLTIRVINSRGLNLLEMSEGFVPHLYNDSAHYCSIAYGRLIKKSPCDGSEPVQYRGTKSKPTGEVWLREDLITAETAVMLGVKVDLTDDQYAALCDFAYNVGGNNFGKSGVLEFVNRKQFDRVPSQLRRWEKAGGKIWLGLVKRRKQEANLFFFGQPVPKGVAIPGEDLSKIDILTGESR